MRWFQNGGIIMPTKTKPTEAYPNQKHNKPTWKNAKKTDRATGIRDKGKDMNKDTDKGRAKDRNWENPA